MILLKIFLENNKVNMTMCIGYEVLFSYFLKEINYKNVILLSNMGLSGLVTVCGTIFNG